MKQPNHIFTMAIILIFVFASLVIAQSKKDEIPDEPIIGEFDSTAVQQNTETDAVTKIEELSNHFDNTVKNFNDLKQHFNKMMQITDMSLLQDEMKKHQDMMKKIHNDMTMQQDMFEDVLSSIEALGGIRGTMNEPEEK